MNLTRPSGIVATLWLCLHGARALEADPGDLVAYLPFETVAPQDLAQDTDGTWWISVFLENRISHYSADLRTPLGSIPYPGLNPATSSYPTGIAVNTRDDTLLVTDALSAKIIEVGRDGTATGRIISPTFEVTTAAPTLRGMSYDPGGDGGNGSVYFVEASAGLIYEVALDGRTLRTIQHPDTPPEFPERGSSASVTDVDLYFDPDTKALSALYVTGGPARVSHIQRLEVDGTYRGISIPLTDAGGNVSSVRRLQFPGLDGVLRDYYLTVVDSNARFALLEGGEPTLRDLTGLTCLVTGRIAQLGWTRHSTYDRIEVARGCEILATLPGDSSEWSVELPAEGVYGLSVEAFAAAGATPPLTCTVVVGPGAVLAHANPGAELPLDLASDGTGQLLLLEGQAHKILLYDQALQPQGEVLLTTEGFAAAEDLLSGLAYSPGLERIYAVNLSQSTIGVFDPTGALVDSFVAAVPNLEEDPALDPDYGSILSAAFDPTGDEGKGTLWTLELERDWIYELRLVGPRRGEILRSFEHPYIAVERPPEDTPFGISASALTLSTTNPDHLILSGGTLREGRQSHIFQVDKNTGLVVPGSQVPTDDLRRQTGTSFATLEEVNDGGHQRLFALAVGGRKSTLLELTPGPRSVPSPTFLVARQPGFGDTVQLAFTSNAQYEAAEIYRDCERIARVDGAPSGYVDASVPAGVHTYRVRGLVAGVPSDFIEARLQVGAGAVLQRSFLWPARSPQQLALDPIDGGFIVVVNWRDDERKLYQYDRAFRFLGVRDAQVEAPWQLAALAIRLDEQGKREICSIIWKQPVPIGQVDQQEFFLVKETQEGSFLDSFKIFPPRPTNGFITYPTGLTWHPPTDTFFYLERNSKTFVQMAPDGTNLRTFPHPDPPFQNFVFNLGMAYSPKRGTFFITGSNRSELRITRAMEMTLDGALTGTEIPLGETGQVPTGIAVVGDELITVGTGGFSEILRLKAFANPTIRFIRGDADANGVVNLTDAITTLGYLFRGAGALPCEDAADADDSGQLNLSDAVTLLRTLFQGSGPLPAPYPESSFDPTPDGLSCQ